MSRPFGGGFFIMEISLFPRQHDFVMSSAKHPACVSGRGGGKTVAGLTKVMKFVGENPGARGIITEPTLGAIERNLIPALYDTYGELEGSLWGLKKSTSSFELSFPSLGSTVYLRPSVGADMMATANSFRGGTLAFFWMDEFQEDYQFEAFRTLVPCLRQRRKDGSPYPYQGWLSGTPHWRKVWIRNIWVDHINPTTEQPISSRDYPMFQMKTEDNTFLDEESKQQLRDLYGNTRLAKQELEGEFITVEGPAFPQFREDIHVRVLTEGVQFRRRGVAGLDFGSARPTALIELGEDLSHRVWAIREFYKRNVDDQDWARTAQEWGIKRIVCDSARSKEQIQNLRQMYGLNISGSKVVSREDRFRLMNTRLMVREDGYPNMYITPQCPNLIREIQNLAFAVDSNGQVLDHWEPGSDDHAYDAVCYGLTEFALGGRGRPERTLELVH